MLIAYILYIVILTVWATISYLAVSHVLRHRHPGDAAGRIVTIYLILSALIIVSSVTVMFGIDWDEVFAL